MSTVPDSECWTAAHVFLELELKLLNRELEVPASDLLTCEEISLDVFCA